ncbi:hypothetical protein GOEFS_028_00070 [Gordonia effusa NBRC 100432]|uniref:Uncharacterized protein n=1 Tax=Gordonia effusa NBRC 100432 TaxID=1077974 RepID=H0QWZ2_9ACTN|nr:hypothetical protein [Gordonia effusa]GAB17343.1 hypothetical protein GOEFS_028_00070 [Gordonia effusa NBRC 100432]
MTRANASESLSLLRPTATLGAWAAAWLAGECSADAVLDTLTAIAPRHRLITDIDDDATDPLAAGDTGTTEILTLLQSATFVELRLPAPGDPHGLPPGVIARQVMRAGEVLLLTTPDDVAPTLLFPGRQLGDQLSWHVAQFEEPATALTDFQVGTAARDLKEATRTAADVLSDLPSMSSGSKDTLRLELAAAVERRTVTLPPHDSSRIDNLLAQAGRIDAILDVASARGATFGLTARQGDGGDAQIRELRAITRRAVTVGVNALIIELLGAPGE